MTHTVSRLALLMQLLGVTGRELGIALQVDHSLVSKWKNNHRPIPVRTGMLAKIADYLIMIDNEKDRNVISSLLASPAAESTPVADSTLRDRLMEWLRDPTNPDQHVSGHSQQHWLSREHYICPVEIFQGESGRRQAVLQIFQILLSQPNPSEIFIMSQEDRAWIDEDPAFSRNLHQLVLQASEKGHRITIIYWLGQEHRSLLNIIREWLPLELQQRMTSYYSPLYRPSAIPLTLYVIPGQAAVTGLMAYPQHKQRHSMLFRDSVTVMHLNTLLQSYLEGCQLMFDTYDLNRRPALLKQIVRASQDIEKKSVFVQMPVPSVLMLPPSIARELMPPDHMDRLREQMAKVDPVLFEQAADLHQHEKSEISRYVYSSSAIRDALQQSSVTDNFHSVLSGHPVNFSPTLFRQLLRLIAKQLRSDPKIEIALLNDEQFESDSWQHLLLLQGELLTVWNNRYDDILLSTRESTLLHAFHLHTERRWQQIPTVCRDRESIISQFDRFSQPD